MLRTFTRTAVLFVVLSSNCGAEALRHYNIVNNCPSDITYFINGLNQGTIAAGGSAARDYGSWFDGYIYTFANGGQSDGHGITRAGFYGEYNYYFTLIDPDYFNTGISITPINHSPSGGFCNTAQCTSINCPNTFRQPPTRYPAPVNGTPPNLPLYECTDQQAGYTVTFCPGGQFPPKDPPRTLHPGADPDKCLDVRGANFANGTPVQIYDCNGTGAQKWVLSRGSTKVRAWGTNYCLDAGSTPGNAVGMKIWQCYDNLPAQQWYYTQDDRIALEGQGLCLDLPNGVTTNSNRLQTWQCTDGNNNQLWYW